MTDQQFQILVTRIDGISNEFRDLVDFLGRKFGRVDQRFERIDQRFERIDQRFEQIDQRFEQIDQRFEQIDQRFEQIDQRFEGMDGRMSRLEVSNEALRHQLQIVAEGVAMNGERLDRHESRLVALERSVERLLPLEGAVSRLSGQVEVLTSRMNALP